MSKLMDIIKKLSGKEEKEEYVPKQVVDRRLDGLRRLREVQHNEDEKVRLKQEIADYNRERTSRHLFGIKGKKELLEKKRNILSKIETQKKVNILSNQRNILSGSLDNKKKEFKKPVNILNDNSTFLR